MSDLDDVVLPTDGDEEGAVVAPEKNLDDEALDLDEEDLNDEVADDEGSVDE